MVVGAAVVGAPVVGAAVVGAAVVAAPEAQVAVQIAPVSPLLLLLDLKTTARFTLGVSTSGALVPQNLALVKSA